MLEFYHASKRLGVSFVSPVTACAVLPTVPSQHPEGHNDHTKRPVQDITARICGSGF
ncbi:hypothetical protein MLPF_0079 [Mycobacterium lepromatosis]|nr:hypothetical protein MLPF_0079 [Mycobacterium lepromatosis]